jgi:hypothetical protein
VRAGSGGLAPSGRGPALARDSPPPGGAPPGARPPRSGAPHASREIDLSGAGGAGSPEAGRAADVAGFTTILRTPSSLGIVLPDA